MGSDPGTSISHFASQIMVEDLWLRPLLYYKSNRPPGQEGEHGEGQVRTRAWNAGAGGSQMCQSVEAQGKVGSDKACRPRRNESGTWADSLGRG